jgi:hypothetical protein
MFSQGAATAPRATALYQDRGIRSMCRIARTDSHRSPVCRRQVFLISVCVQRRSFLAIARFDRDFDFVVTGVLDREQDASIGFIGELPQQLSLLVVLLDEGQSAVSDGARAGHGSRQLQGELPIGTDVAIDKVPKRFRNVVTINIAAALNFEGDIS